MAREGVCGKSLICCCCQQNVVLFCLIRVVTSIAFSGVYALAKGFILKSMYQWYKHLHLINTKFNLVNSQLPLVNTFVWDYAYIESDFFFNFFLYTLLTPFGKFVFVTQRNCVATERRH